MMQREGTILYLEAGIHDIGWHPEAQNPLGTVFTGLPPNPFFQVRVLLGSSTLSLPWAHSSACSIGSCLLCLPMYLGCQPSPTPREIYLTTSIYRAGLELLASGFEFCLLYWLCDPGQDIKHSMN